METELTQWLLPSTEPWTCYRTLVDLLDQPESSEPVLSARQAMLAHPQVQGLFAEVANWPAYALKRHNDAGHPIYKLSTLVDFGLKASDPGMATILAAVMEHQSPQGAFQVIVNIPRAFGGTDEDMWTWMLCDAPTLLYALLAMGLGDDPRVKRAVEHLAGLIDENGWRCVGAPELGKFRGPGRKSDPCPIANVYALKALALVPELLDSSPTRVGTEMLLRHWEQRGETKMYLFGIGTDFLKIKYPFVWYDLLHVVEVLSHFPFVYADPRFQQMMAALFQQGDEPGRYTASSMYQTWKGWSFADKKNPSPWLSFLVQRIRRRVNQKG